MQDDAKWLERVLSLADSRGLAQRRIVEAAGVEPARIDKWRKGSKPTLQNLIGIARLLDVSLDWIATGAGPSAGFPKDPLTDEERSLLWMLRTIGVTPEEAAARVNAGPVTASGGVKVRGVRVRERSPASNSEPTRANLDDSPARPISRGKRRGGALDLDLPGASSKLKDERK